MLQSASVCFSGSWPGLAGGVVYRADILWADVASLIIELSIPIAGWSW